MVVGVAFWSAVHMTLHLCSFALDVHNTTSDDHNTTGTMRARGGGEVGSRSNHFMDSLATHLCPAVTGVMILVALGVMCVSALPVIRKQMRFIVFYMVHWMTTIFVYILILIHGDRYWNPSFWKWLLPLLFAMGFELVHRHWITPKYTVIVKTAGPYDDVSRVTVIETEKPKQFDFLPGQFVMLNFQKIGKLKPLPSLHSSFLKTLFICRLLWLASMLHQLRTKGAGNTLNRNRLHGFKFSFFSRN